MLSKEYLLVGRKDGLPQASSLGGIHSGGFIRESRDMVHSVPQGEFIEAAGMLLGTVIAFKQRVG